MKYELEFEGKASQDSGCFLNFLILSTYRFIQSCKIIQMVVPHTLPTISFSSKFLHSRSIIPIPANCIGTICSAYSDFASFVCTRFCVGCVCICGCVQVCKILSHVQIHVTSPRSRHKTVPFHKVPPFAIPQTSGNHLI